MRTIFVLCCLAAFVFLSAAEEEVPTGLGAASFRGCNVHDCNRFCQQRGKKSGHCINFKTCRCSASFFDLDETPKDLVEDETPETVEETPRNFVEDETPEAELSSEPQEPCIYPQCNINCKRAGKRGGHCVNFWTCRCTRTYFFLEAPLSDLQDEAEEPRSVTVRSRHCNPILCVSECQKRGKRGGYCHDRECRCLTK